MKNKDVEQALHELRELRELRDYLREKIEFLCDHYETRARKIDRGYLAQVAKLGKRIKDPALVRFLQQIAQPSHIAAELQRIRKLLTAGKLIDAHIVLEELRFRLEYLEGHRKRRYLTAGFGVVSGGEKAAKGQRQWTADRYSRMRERFQCELATILSREQAEKKAKGQVYKNVAKAFSTSTRTVRKTVRGR